MANLRKVTGVLRKAISGEPWVGARVTIKLITDPAYQPGQVFPVVYTMFNTDSDGSVPPNVFITTPDSGAWRYQVTIHGNKPFSVYISGVGDISLDELLALADMSGVETGSPQIEWLLLAYNGSLVAPEFSVLFPDGIWRTLGTASTLDASEFDPAGSAEDVFNSVIPRITPALQGHLVVLNEDGTLAGAGYTAKVQPDPDTVVRRNSEGSITGHSSTGEAVRGDAENDATGVYGSSEDGTGVRGYSENGYGGASDTLHGDYHHVFGLTVPTVSAISRASGILTFLGSNAEANRLAQTHELKAVSWASQSISPTDRAQARQNIGAEESGAASAVNESLNIHTENSLIHFTQSEIEIEPEQARADPAGSAAIVQSNLNTLTNIHNANVNGSYLINASLASVFNLTLLGDATISFSNLMGRVIEVNIIQNSDGNKNVEWLDVQWGTNGEPTLLKTANSRSKMSFSNNGFFNDGHLIATYE